MIPDKFKDDYYTPGTLVEYIWGHDSKLYGVGTVVGPTLQQSRYWNEKEYVEVFWAGLGRSQQTNKRNIRRIVEDVERVTLRLRKK